MREPRRLKIFESALHTAQFCEVSSITTHPPLCAQIGTNFQASRIFPCSKSARGSNCLKCIQNRLEWLCSKVWQSSWAMTYRTWSFDKNSNLQFRLIRPAAEQLPHRVRWFLMDKSVNCKPVCCETLATQGIKAAFACRANQRLKAA